MNNLAHKEPVMMRGTGGGLDYHMVAFKGRFGIGFKMLGMSPGIRNGVPNTVHYAVRIRAARLPEDLYNKIANDSAVMSIADPEAHPASVFNGIDYGKTQEGYASTILAGFFGPDFAIGEDEKLVGGEDIRNGKARQQFVDHIKKAFADTGAVQILADDEMLEIMEKFEQIVMKNAWSYLLSEKIGNAEKQSSVGIITSQNDLAVKIKKKMQEIDPELASAPDSMETVKHQTENDDIIDPDDPEEIDGDYDADEDDED